MEKTYKLPENLLIELLNYLSSKPYREVAGAVQALQQLTETEQTE